MSSGQAVTEQRDILKNVHDTTNDALRTTITNAEVEINVSAFTDSIKIGDGTGQTATITDLGGGVKAIDVNVADILISHTNDSIKIGDGTDLLAINSDGSTNTIIYGTADNNTAIPIGITDEGHVEVVIHSPLNPFGSLHVEGLRADIQADGVYTLDNGVTGNHLTTISGSGSATNSDSSLVVSTGTTIYSQGVIQSRKRIKYRQGQGIVARFSALYTSPVSNSYQIAGLGHAEDGIYVGYKNTDFGILYVNRGVREVRTLTISTRSTTAENITVTLNGVAFSVAVTNAASTQLTAYEISQGTYSGWKAEQIGSTVIFVADAVGAKAGSFSITGTTVVGSFATTITGAASNETHIAQSSWNGDKLDGTGLSGFTLDPTKFNVFQIKLEYLGAGVIVFEAEVPKTDKNNASWVVFHTMKLPNTLTTTSFGNPSFPFTMAAYSAGSTTNLTLKCGSYGAFIEGEKIIQGNRFTYYNSLTTVGATNFQSLFTLRNKRVFGSRTNQVVVHLNNITAAVKHTSPTMFFIIRQATLQGTPNFTSNSTNSCTVIDTSATTCTFSSNDQIVWSGFLGDTGNISYDFLEIITLQPGETITLAAKSLTGSPSYVVGSINTKEDR